MPVHILSYTVTYCRNSFSSALFLSNTSKTMKNQRKMGTVIVVSEAVTYRDSELWRFYIRENIRGHS